MDIFPDSSGNNTTDLKDLRFKKNPVTFVHQQKYEIQSFSKQKAWEIFKI